MKIVLCTCTQCRYHRKSFRSMIDSKKGGHRRRVKEFLKSGEYDKIPEVLIIGYTS